MELFLGDTAAGLSYRCRPLGIVEGGSDLGGIGGRIARRRAARRLSALEVTVEFAHVRGHYRAGGRQVLADLGRKPCLGPLVCEKGDEGRARMREKLQICIPSNVADVLNTRVCSG